MYKCMYVCMYMYLREREREGGRESEREESPLQQVLLVLGAVASRLLSEKKKTKDKKA